MARKPEEPVFVLVVEDEPNWQGLIRELLQEVASKLDHIIEIVIASSFSEALDQISTTSFDFVTLDNELKDGRMAKTLLDRVANLEQRVPVVVISGVVNPKDVRDFFQDYRIEEFFWKNDFEPEMFRQTFTELLEHAEDVETFTWLHLSDLHFEATVQREFEVGQVVKALQNDLKWLREEYQGLKPDAVFFTGDLAHKAKPDEFAKAFEMCLNPILEECDLKPSDLFIVPGNHDVDRSQTTKIDVSIVQQLDRASDIHALLNDSLQAGYRQQLLQRMNTYKAAVGSIAGLPFDAEALSWGCTLESESGHRIGVIGLNSVWTSASVEGSDGEVDDQGKLIVGRTLLQAALEQIEGSEPKTCIALMHHPISWLQHWDEQDIRRVLREECRFVLHGHVHETTVDFLGDPSPSTMVVSAGALFKKYDQSDFHTCLHAYNLVRLDLASSEGTIYFRRFDPVSGRYGMDDTTFEHVRNGQCSFQCGGVFRPDSG